MALNLLWLLRENLDMRSEQTTILCDGQVRFIYLLGSKSDVLSIAVLHLLELDIWLVRFLLRNYIGE